MKEEKSSMKVVKGPSEKKVVKQSKVQDAKEKIKKVKEEPVMLIRPRKLPVNGRIIAQPFKLPDFETKSNIVLPSHLARAGKTNRELENMNPYSGHVFIVVAMAPRMDKEMPLPQFYYHKTGKYYPTKLEIGDMIILSDRFEPIEMREDDTWYVIVHHMDVLSVEKSANNMEKAVNK